MTIKLKYFKYTYLALFVLIIWDALKVYFSLHHPLIQFAVLLPAILFGLADNKRELLKSAVFLPNLIWLLWILYALFNTFIINSFQHHRGQNAFVFISSVIFPFLFLLFIVSNKYKTHDLLNVLIFAYFFRLLLSFVFDDIATLGYDDIARLGADFNANSIALGALFIIVIIGIKKIQYNKISKFDLLCIVSSIVGILLTSSKKAFLLSLVFAIGCNYVTRSKDFIKNIIRYSFVFLFVVVFFSLLVENTNIGQRLIHTYNKTIEADRPEQMFDHRANQYIVGWRIFADNPINGVGLAGYVKESGYTTPLHTEYMIQLAETGTIGTFLFALFYTVIIIKLLRIRKVTQDLRVVSEIYILAILIMLGLLLGTWQYNNLKNWVLIALSIRFVFENRLIVARVPYRGGVLQQTGTP